MDFFAHQEAARVRTWRLVAMFVLAALGVALGVYLVLAAIANFSSGHGRNHWWRPELFMGSCAATFLVVGVSSLVKTAQLRAGGGAVAEGLGGRLVDGSTRDPVERRLLNVVEEMAIAAGLPVPPVYLLPEDGINAFAAGFLPGDAVVGVTRGTAEQLSRDELQGVIGHEFSHILNGDMRLNIRLIGVIHGILALAIAGQLILRMLSNVRVEHRGDRDERDRGGNSGGIVAALAILGVGLLVVGGIGHFFGRMIQSMVSRQREFLADASAVQFTRNPDGIAGALKRIGGYAGSRMESVRAQEVPHMFFSAGLDDALSKLFATHPPLRERIQRVEPRFDGAFPARPETPPALAEIAAGAAGLAPAAPSARDAERHIGAPRPEHVAEARATAAALPPELFQAAHDPDTARAVVVALLLADNHRERTLAFEQWRGLAEQLLGEDTRRLLPIAVRTETRHWLPLVELCYPALCRLTRPQRERFDADVRALIAADRRMTLFEFTVQHTLLRRLLQRDARPPLAALTLRDVRAEAVCLLGGIAYAGDEPQASAAFAAGANELRLAAALPPAEACAYQQVGVALDRLTLLAPAGSGALLHAAAAAIRADGRMTVAEGELFRAVGDALDCPVPPLVETAAGLP